MAQFEWFILSCVDAFGFFIVHALIDNHFEHAACKEGDGTKEKEKEVKWFVASSS